MFEDYDWKFEDLKEGDTYPLFANETLPLLEDGLRWEDITKISNPVFREHRKKGEVIHKEQGYWFRVTSQTLLNL